MKKQEAKSREPEYYHPKIKDWPEQERPREKLNRFGPGALSDAELLALLIESGTGGITAVDLAKRLLMEHRSLPLLAKTSLVELTRMKGIGTARGARIVAAFEIGRRIGSGLAKKPVRVNAPEDLFLIKYPNFRDMKREIFEAVLLDSGNRIIRDVTISQGTLNASIVHPREVFKAAVDHLAAALILIHNHPSGNKTPSMEDRQVTQQMIKAGEIMGIPVLDHIIIADNEYFSFVKEGLMKP